MAKDSDRGKDKKQKSKIKVTNSDPKRLVKDDDSSEVRDEVSADSRPSDGNQRSVSTDEPADTSTDSAVADRSQEVAELKRHLLRVSADFDNFKRRTQEERAEMFDTARAEMALKLMPVIDNFDRAAEHVPEAVKEDPWYAGIEGIRKQFADLLGELGIERIESVGEAFDPNRHEAVSHEPSDEYDEDVVSKELEAGYVLGDSVIRPAKVIVSKGDS